MQKTLYIRREFLTSQQRTAIREMLAHDPVLNTANISSVGGDQFKLEICSETALFLSINDEYVPRILWHLSATNPSFSKTYPYDWESRLKYF